MPRFKPKEVQFINLLQNKDPVTCDAFALLLEYVTDQDKANSTHYLPVVNLIYLERPKAYKWELANMAHVSMRTLDRYRDIIIGWFEYFCKKVGK